MDTLRWILLIVGLLLIAGLFGYYKWQEMQASRPRGRRSKSSRAARKKGRAGRARDVEAALQEMDDFLIDDDIVSTPELDDPELASMEIEPGDEPVTREPSRVSHHEEDEYDSSIGPVRVRRVAEDVDAPDRHPPAEAGMSLHDADDPDDRHSGWPEQAGEDDRPEVTEAAGHHDETWETREVEDNEDGWALGPVRIRRPAWVRDTSHGDGERDDEPVADHSALEDNERVVETVGEKIIVLHIHAGEGLCFTAQAVQEALDAVGLRFGQHDIYHRHVDTRRGEEPMYSVASMVKPGTLNPNDPDTLETPGLAMFLRLPGPFDGLSAFEQMLETARRLADQLDGHLLDATRCDLTAQAVEHIREDLREYRRLTHLAARKTRA